jgi:hypothetical protein
MPSSEEIVVDFNADPMEVHNACSDISRFQFFNGVILSLLFTHAILSGIFWWYIVAVCATIFLLGIKETYQKIKIISLFKPTVKGDLS